jgi:hypothetical protein
MLIVVAQKSQTFSRRRSQLSVEAKRQVANVAHHFPCVLAVLTDVVDFSPSWTTKATCFLKHPIQEDHNVVQIAKAWVGLLSMARPPRHMHGLPLISQTQSALLRRDSLTPGKLKACHSRTACPFVRAFAGIKLRKRTRRSVNPRALLSLSLLTSV